MSPATDLEVQIRALEGLDLEGLRAEWRGLWGRPPKLRSVELLRSLLAWRLQARALGGFTGAERRALRTSTPRGTGPVLQPGARLTREWKGVLHEVEVAESGFRYQGANHASLSEIARVITGARWNGPRFFGLRQGAAR